jgi:hypothetical protein
MHLFLVILLSLTLFYLLGIATVLTVSILILRQKLRRYQESGRFGY